MNTDRELMQQALEALLSYEQYIHPLTNFFGGPEVPREGSTSAKVEDAITALRERLAQPNEFNPDWDAMAVMVEEQQRMAKRIAELEAQPEQEPVATVVKRQYEDGTYAGNALDWAGRNCEDDLPVGTKLYTDPQPVKFNCTVVDDAHPEGVPLSQWGKQQKQKPFCYHDGRNIVGKEYAYHCDVFPLYTESQPEQKPLTHEQIESIWDSTLSEDVGITALRKIARAIEAAHGIGEKPDAA